MDLTEKENKKCEVNKSIIEGKITKKEAKFSLRLTRRPINLEYQEKMEKAKVDKKLVIKPSKNHPWKNFKIYKSKKISLRHFEL